MTAELTLHAWVDESMHAVGERDGLYILAAVVCDAAGCEPIRDALRSLLDNRQPKLHWSSESEERREKIIGSVAQIDMAAVVVVGTHWPRKSRSGRARYAWSR